MSLIHFCWPGPPEQRASVKLTAMQPIGSGLAEACSKLKPSLDPSTMRVTLNKKPVDLATPFRLANIPAGTSLRLEPLLPTAAAPAVATTVQQPPPAAVPAPTLPAQPGQPDPALPPTGAPLLSTAAFQVPQAAPLAPPAALAAAPEQAPLLQRPMPSPSLLSSAAAAAAAAAEAVPLGAAPLEAAMQAPQLTGAAASSAPVPAATAAGQAPPAAAAAPSPHPAQAPPPPQPALPQAGATSGPVPSLSAVLGLGREVVLLTEDALHQATASTTEAPGANEDLPDDFFELTTEDYAAWARAMEAKKKEESAGFKTKAMREQEARAKAGAFGSVPVRVHLPGKLVLQAAFAATETIGALQALVRQALLPSMAGASYLYTTPPRQVLKDLDASLYQAGLVPAAHVHLGLDTKKVPGGASVQPEALFKPEALHHVISTAEVQQGQLQLPGQQGKAEAEREQRLRQQERVQAQQSLQGLRGVSAGTPSSSAGRSAAASTSDGVPKVPKWLKLK